MVAGERVPATDVQDKNTLAWAWPEFQREDPLLAKLRNALMAKEMPEIEKNAAPENRGYLEAYPSMLLDKGVLCFKDAKSGANTIVVPIGKEKLVFQAMHESAHHGIKATKSRVKAIFWWPTLGKDVESFMRECKTCDVHWAHMKAPRAELGELPRAGPFEIVFLDLVGGQSSLTTSETCSRTILSMIDSFTEWAEAVPIPDQTAKNGGQNLFRVLGYTVRGTLQGPY